MIVAVTLALMVVAGCDTQGDPAPPPPSQDALTTTTPSDDVVATSEAAPTTAEPTEADGPPTMPEEAKEKTEAGAEAFVEYWIEGLNSAYKTGDTGDLMDYSSDQCGSCSGLVSAVPKSGLGDDYMRVKSAEGLLIGKERASVTTEVKVLIGEGKGLGVIVFELSDGDPWMIESITLKSEPS
ncbi:MAG: DUF6318 family protein [Ornithinimicrobium sp.]|uniref:DUF6318 family protein n=1 Tax=Ornithinimicrobium sp. TaxID=1977084 RepID=UPI0026DF51B1|nr:DUF6318 family protein [Ornithinimicrobium sp.]MDO5741227.1 DUF6318 family protein [Ornithinimicrobium sp.]